MYLFLCRFYYPSIIASITGWNWKNYKPTEAYPPPPKKKTLVLIKAIFQGFSVKKRKRLWHRCFPVNFAKFLRTSSFTENYRWVDIFCFINMYKYFDTKVRWLSDFVKRGYENVHYREVELSRPDIILREKLFIFNFVKEGVLKNFVIFTIILR